ncbi:MAG: DNA-3-methyladenine glycosylase 2 family protein [Pseudomonadota bacterium]
MTWRGDDPETEAASKVLAKRCGSIKTVLDNTGPPRWRSRPGGYPGLARIIIEQQLSVASANAILARAKSATSGLKPRATLAAKEEELQSLGLSRPKIRYLKTLADDVLSRRFSFSKLSDLTDGEASEALCALLGVGPWTASVYLLFCENRRDLWPRGDVALLAAHGMAGGSYTRDQIADFDAWAEDRYAPHRGTAAHILWGQIAFSRGKAPL